MPPPPATASMRWPPITEPISSSGTRPLYTDREQSTTMVGDMLHVRCGDDILPALAEAGLPGERLAWVDPVSEGPLTEGVEGAAWYAMRAAWLAGRHHRDETEVLADLRAQDDALARAGEH